VILIRMMLRKKYKIRIRWRVDMRVQKQIRERFHAVKQARAVGDRYKFVADAIRDALNRVWIYIDAHKHDQAPLDYNTVVDMFGNMDRQNVKEVLGNAIHDKICEGIQKALEDHK
jgi:hypothetical protein